MFTYSMYCAVSTSETYGVVQLCVVLLLMMRYVRFYDQASRSWKKKLDAERRMLALAKQVVKYHKERVKQRQQHLLLCQNRWRDQWQLCR